VKEGCREETGEWLEFAVGLYEMFFNNLCKNTSYYIVEWGF
jgi:hypothetical protein